MLSQKKHRTKRRKPLSQLEPLMRGVQEALRHDLGDFELSHLCESERGSVIPGSMGWPPYLFKKAQQISAFDKRIIWPEDKSFDDLSRESFEAFADSQKTFGLPEPLSQRASLALHHAAEICQRILGDFDYDEWFDSCSYGKRAAYKLPRRIAYLDTRLVESSGTKSQKVAFGHALSRDVHLLRAVRSVRKQRSTYEHISVTAVPKSFKSARIIAPDTILGGFLSRGLGSVIRKRLEEETHINLAKQQERHRRWAKTASRTGHLSTIDMSKASDSFTWRHIECVVPKSWHDALNVVRTERCEVLGRRIPLASYMLMGSGHTFPLQTLLFYCFAEATRTLLNCRGKVSVYGDDIIVPTWMSHHFIVIMTELGFTINSEKSFFDKVDPDRPSKTFFRESCGGDFKGGIDVRPYMPECDLQSGGAVPRNEYLAWCHKLINGLLARWSAYEIPTTLSLILNRIESTRRAICFVPKWEVDHSGIRYDLPAFLLIGRDVSYITYVASHPSYWRLTFHEKKRKRPMKERAYIWYKYFLSQNNVPSCDRRLPLFYLLAEEALKKAAIAARDGLYGVPTNGEPRRDQKGQYRWTKFGPGEPAEHWALDRPHVQMAPLVRPSQNLGTEVM